MKTISELIHKHYNSWAVNKDGDHSEAFWAGARAACKALRHVKKRRRKKVRKP